MTAAMHRPHLMTDLKFRSIPAQALNADTSGLLRARSVGGTWLPTLTDRLLDLGGLPLGWDGDRGLPVGFEIVRITYDLLRFLCDEGMPEPAVVPTPSGGLQIEWHDNETEIDLEISPEEPASVFIWMMDESGNEREYEGDLMMGADHLGEALGRMSAAANPSDR